MGQLRANGCPLCSGENGGKWTCPDCAGLVNVHRELIRNLQSWHALYEAAEAPDVLIAADGQGYSLWDVSYFYDQRWRLPHQQKAAMELFLYQNVLERHAAEAMGVSRNSPVAIYATVALTRLLRLAWDGELPGYYLDITMRGDPHGTDAVAPGDTPAAGGSGRRAHQAVAFGRHESRGQVGYLDPLEGARSASA